MTSSRWPTQNKLNGIFGGSLPHNAKLGHLIFILKGPLYILLFLALCFYGIPTGVNLCVSACLCISCAFSLTPFLISLCSNIFVFIYLILFLLLFFRWFFFLVRDRKMGGEVERNWESRRRETVIRIYYLWKKSIFNK